MKLVSWNVNSIKARKDHVLRFIDRVQPNCLMLQELKGVDFPSDAFEGYHTHAVTQKAYNGVAILSKHPVAIIHDALPGDESDDQARYLEIKLGGLHIINIYAPNGNPAPGDKYDYKLTWMARLYDRLKTLRSDRIPFVIGGDFNVIPDDEDCYDPKAWKDDALFRPETLSAYRKLLNLGLYDAFRIFNKTPNQYTFWDYQRGAWQKNNGIRIDHFLLSPEIADIAKSCEIDNIPRGEERPSDHTPIILEIDDKFTS